MPRRDSRTRSQIRPSKSAKEEEAADSGGRLLVCHNRRGDVRVPDAMVSLEPLVVHTGSGNLTAYIHRL